MKTQLFRTLSCKSCIAEWEVKQMGRDEYKLTCCQLSLKINSVHFSVLWEAKIVMHTYSAVNVQWGGHYTWVKVHRFYVYFIKYLFFFFLVFVYYCSFYSYFEWFEWYLFK